MISKPVSAGRWIVAGCGSTRSPPANVSVAWQVGRRPVWKRVPQRVGGTVPPRRRARTTNPSTPDRCVPRRGRGRSGMVNMPQLATGRVALPTFWGGGFDSPSPLARLSGRAARIDLVAATAHDQHAADDYALLAQLGIGWSREDVRWHCCE